MPITLTEYAVRVKGTQKYLPRPQRRDGRGGSHLEPVDFSDRTTWPKAYAQDMQIRSYSTVRAAKNLLSSWLQGGVGCHRGSEYPGEYYEENFLIPKPHRRAEDMEIVQITITLPEPFARQEFDDGSRRSENGRQNGPDRSELHRRA